MCPLKFKCSSQMCPLNFQDSSQMCPLQTTDSTEYALSNLSVSQMCPFLTMNLNSNVPPQNKTRLICSTQVSFAATAFKILICTGFSADTGKHRHWVEQTTLQVSTWPSSTKLATRSVKAVQQVGMSTFRIPNGKIRPLGGLEKIYVLYIAMAENPLSSGRKWFLR